MKTTIANNRSKEKTEHGNPVANEFDRVAFIYETNRLSLWYKSHAQIIMQAFNNPLEGFSLDIGCGTGWLLRQIAKSSKHFKGIGIDISSNMITVAKKTAGQEQLGNLEFIQGNWEDMDLSFLSDKNVTTIICANAFHYFVNPKTSARKMYQILSKGGQFFLLERDKEDSIMTTIWDIFHKFLIKDQVRFYPFNELDNFFKFAGFSDVLVIKKIRKFFWKKKIYTSMVLLSGQKI